MILPESQPDLARMVVEVSVTVDMSNITGQIDF